MKKLAVLAASALALSAVSAAQAHEYQKGALTIIHPWVRPAVKGANGAVYLSIKNAGSEADKLIAAESPVAGKTGLHETRDENGVMKMRPVEGGVEVQPGTAQELKPGGTHIMLMDLKEGLEEGASVPLTITLAKAGTVTVEVKVEKTTPDSAAAMPMHGMDHSKH